MFKLNEDLCLKYLENEPRTVSTESAPVIIFLHGRGANEVDLFDLAAKIDPRFRVICPRAPINMGEASYGWFHTEYLPSGPRHDRNESEYARNVILQFIAEVKVKYNLKSSDLFLFGFSQGGMLSLSVALHFPETIAGVAALSCRILPEFEPVSPFPEGLHDFPILLSHGVDDEVLRINYGRDAKKLIAATPVRLTYFEYPMGHDVTDMNFSDVVDWLALRLQVRQKNLP